jgi:hypothetical protein
MLSPKGKSFFLKELCRNYRQVFDPPLSDNDPPLVILYSYQTERPKIKLERDVIYYILGLPSLKNILEVSERHKSNTSGVIVVLDDVLSALESLSTEESNDYQKLVVEWSRLKVKIGV